MPLWTELARSLTGEALITAVGAELHRQCVGASHRACPPADAPHWRRRALAMLRQAHINPFRRTARVIASEPGSGRGGQQHDLEIGAGPHLDAAVRNNSMGHAQPTNENKAQDHVA